MSFKAKYPQLTQLLEFGEVEQTEEGVHFQPEQLATIEATVAENATLSEAAATHQTTLQSAQDAQQAAEQNLATANGTISTQATEIADLKSKLSKRPGEGPSGSTQTEDPIIITGKSRFAGMKTDLSKHRKTN
jgi:chromosome segregation ATPase